MKIKEFILTGCKNISKVTILLLTKILYKLMGTNMHTSIRTIGIPLAVEKLFR